MGGGTVSWLDLGVDRSTQILLREDIDEDFLVSFEETNQETMIMSRRKALLCSNSISDFGGEPNDVVMGECGMTGRGTLSKDGALGLGCGPQLLLRGSFPIRDGLSDLVCGPMSTLGSSHFSLNSFIYGVYVNKFRDQVQEEREVRVQRGIAFGV
ncbi:hypothetical protein D8674_021669 [Pyrus ussuriensis x Pyrus communis]|uniref:Uncharacterized protein n=1 Tax=Pyrus ussuriensis x Pyrus communis TaxID=2448454 RepID=A0A5N5GMI6_9ROSA|nr:hypothetical protein D8674_021669 [Pyrus ussuriensis x Pyrus communis]